MTVPIPTMSSSPSRTTVKSKNNKSSLLAFFINSQQELARYKNGAPIIADGQTISIPAVIAVSRYNAKVTLSDDAQVKEQVAASRAVIARKAEANTSIYGVSTGFGGSADTRTDDTLALGAALLQHQHIGVLPTAITNPPAASAQIVLPNLDPMATTSMPEAWVRAAILIRINSLIRGHSGVRWELIERMADLLKEDITPLIPLRASISASGDLSPLSYIAGTLVGNPRIRVFTGPHNVLGPRSTVPSRVGLHKAGLSPLPLQSKEHLGILNGTAFSAGTAALALYDATQLAILSCALTALGTEALVGTRGSFDPFIHSIARPHPGQAESANLMWDLLQGSGFASQGESEVNIDEDEGQLRQDRYPLRTAPQFLGPQLEDIVAAVQSVTLECNCTTDNPLIDGSTGHIHHGGNFQAMSVTNALEKSRLALHHIGRLMFTQHTELLNPLMNRGLPPSAASTDPSLNYHCKGVDIACAAYLAELGHVAAPVSTHIQSAEMHNQAVNSMALVSARETLTGVQLVSLIAASYLYVLCQCLDVRTMQCEFLEELGIEGGIIESALEAAFANKGDEASKGLSLDTELRRGLRGVVARTMVDAFERTSTMDADTRMRAMAEATIGPLLNYLTSSSNSASPTLEQLGVFQSHLAKSSTALLTSLQKAYHTCARGPAPSSPSASSASLSRLAPKTKPLYEYVRLNLGVKMHGNTNLERFVSQLEDDGLGGMGGEGFDESVGESISRIYEAIRDGGVADVLVRIVEGMC